MISRLIDVIERGHVNQAKVLELLIEGSDPNETNSVYGWSCLHVAARDGNLNLAKSLIKFGADLEMRDTQGQTPLHRAAFWGRIEIVMLLLNNGADFTSLDVVFQTPTDLARQNNHLECLSILQTQFRLLELGGLDGYTQEQLTKMHKQVNIKEIHNSNDVMLKSLIKKQSKFFKFKNRFSSAKISQKQRNKNEDSREEEEKKEKCKLQQVTKTKPLQRQDSIETKKLHTRRRLIQSFQGLSEFDKGEAWIRYINSEALVQ